MRSMASWEMRKYHLYVVFYLAMDWNEMKFISTKTEENTTDKKYKAPESGGQAQQIQATLPPERSRSRLKPKETFPAAGK